jgi:hypothetical protein
MGCSLLIRLLQNRPYCVANEFTFFSVMAGENIKSIWFVDMVYSEGHELFALFFYKPILFKI